MSRFAKARPLLRVWPFLRPRWPKLLLAVLAMFATSAISLAIPLTVRQIIDGFNNASAESIDRFFFVALMLAVFLSVATACRYALVTGLGEEVVADIRRSVFGQVVGLSPAYFERVLTGEVISRLNTDTTLVQTVIESTISVAVRNSLVLVGGLLLMLITSPTMCLLVLLVVPLILVPLLTLGRRLRVQSKINQEKIADAAAEATETLLAVQAVQANTHESGSRNRFDGLINLSLAAAQRRIRIRALLTMLVILLAFCSVVGVVWFGVQEVRSGSMSFGLLTQFVIYSVMVAGAVAAISEVWSELLRAAGASERLFELLEAVDPVIDPKDAVTLPPRDSGSELKFDSVTFRYPTRPEVSALADVTFTIAPGETVALVGPSGAGKSTILNLALRFFDPISGTVSLDRVDLKRMKRNHFRRRMALVPQDPAIFSTSARENIRFGRPDASDEEIESAARAGQIHEFLVSLPDGYDTLVGERGVLLSGGQKQRIAIARAILRDAPVLLLDEATSSLDPESEASIQQAVEQMSSKCTTLIIAHRLATVQMADRILVFDQGTVVAEGNHDQLVRQGGLYARFADLQFNPSRHRHEFDIAQA